MIKNDHKWPKMMKNDMKTFEIMVNWWKTDWTLMKNNKNDEKW